MEYRFLNDISNPGRYPAVVFPPKKLRRAISRKIGGFKLTVFREIYVGVPGIFLMNFLP